MVNIRWDLKENLQNSKENKEDKKDDDNSGNKDEERSKKGPKKIKGEVLEGILLLASYYNFKFVWLVLNIRVRFFSI